MTESIAQLPPGHQTMLLAHRAMVRDLDRVARTADQLSRTATPNGPPRCGTMWTSSSR